MDNFEAAIRTKVDKLISDIEDKKEIYFPEGFNEVQDLMQDIELANEHENEIEWLKEIMIASVLVFKHNEMDKFKSLQEEIEHYCKLSESYNLYMRYDALLDEIYGKTNEQTGIE
jgi:polyhydroxyalkanoate synthesis regulator phasin